MEQVIRKGQFWYVDLSPVVGEEIGGYRKCRIEHKRGNLVRVTPRVMTNNGFVYDTWHTRTVEVSKTKRKNEKIMLDKSLNL